MQKLQYKTSGEFRGPWFLSVDSLRKLDQTIEQWIKRREAEPEISSEKLEDDSWVGYTELQKKREVSLYCADGTTHVYRCFEDAFNDPQLAEKKVSGINISLIDHCIILELRTHTYIANSSISVRIERSEDLKAAELFRQIENWANAIGPTRFDRLWQQLAPAGPSIILLAFFVIPVIYLLFFVGSASERRLKLPREEVRVLLENGIEPGEESQALQYLLSKSYSIGSLPEVTISPWLWFTMATVLFVGVSWTFPPRLQVELGGGANSYHRWRLWRKFVLILAPSFIAANVIIPYLQKLLP